MPNALSIAMNGAHESGFADPRGICENIGYQDKNQNSRTQALAYLRVNYVTKLDKRPDGVILNLLHLSTRKNSQSDVMRTPTRCGVLRITI